MPDDAAPPSNGKRRAGPGQGKKVPVGRGAGWGGPAKGAATRESLTLVEPDNTLGLNGRKGAVDENGVPVRRRLDKQEQLETIKDVWWREMHTATDTGYRIVAADKLYDRLDGKAVAREEKSGPGGKPLTVTYRWAKDDDDGEADDKSPQVPAG